MSRRSLIIALIVSLAANALLIGVLAGDRWWGQPRAMHEAGIGRLLDTVPAQARPAVRAELREHRFELMRALRDVRRARLQVRKAANALPTAQDRTTAQVRLETSLDELRQATNRVQTLLHRAIVLGLAQAPPEPVGAPTTDEVERRRRPLT